MLSRCEVTRSRRKQQLSNNGFIFASMPEGATELKPRPESERGSANDSQKSREPCISTEGGNRWAEMDRCFDQSAIREREPLCLRTNGNRLGFQLHILFPFPFSKIWRDREVGHKSCFVQTWCKIAKKASTLGRMHSVFISRDCWCNYLKVWENIF